MSEQGPPAITQWLNDFDQDSKKRLYLQMQKGLCICDVLTPGVLHGDVDADGLHALVNAVQPDMTGIKILRLLTCHTPRGQVHQQHVIYQFRFGPDTKQRKTFTHVIAYAAHTDRALPTLGKGQSIDHLCGQKACSNPSHLSLAIRHADNVARIGCLGTTLIVRNTTIIHMRPCVHATDEEDVASLPGCKKVHVIRLPESVFVDE